MFIEVEFDDDIDVTGSTYYTNVEVEATGEVTTDQEVTNLKIISLYDKENGKSLSLKDLDKRERQRLLEKAEDKILTKFVNEGGNTHDDYNDHNDYYDGDLASIQSTSEE